MLKAHWKIISRIERVGDNILIGIAFLIAYYCRDEIWNLLRLASFPLPTSQSGLGPLDEYLVVLGVGLPLFNATLSITGAYRSMRYSSSWKLLRQVFVSSSVVFLSLGSILYVLKLDLSRIFVGTFCVISCALLFTERFFVLEYLRYWRARGKNFRNLLIVGTGDQARRVFFEVSKLPELGLKVVGFVDFVPQRFDDDDYADEVSAAVEREASSVYDLSARVVADPFSFEKTLKRLAIDEVLFTDVLPQFATVEKLAKMAVEEGVRVSMVADMFSLGFIQSDSSYFGSIPLIHYEAAPADAASLILKRIIDIFVSISVLVLFLPFLLLVALLIKADSRGPIFFRQKRVGLNGRMFWLLKFRSMVPDAEERLHSLRQFNEMSGPVFKLREDPRITRVGKWLRRFSIDELPQLINVLRGDMSLVGPRPPLPDEVSLYVRKHRRRLSMRPGLTCIWQVSGRNEIPDFDTWAELDLQYIDNWSLSTDFKLMLKTIPAVLTGIGAR